MSQEENKAVVRRYYELLDQGDVDSIGPLFADDFAWRFTGQPEPLNKDTLGGMVQAFKAAFPDMTHTLDTQITEGNTVVTPLTFTGTQTGDLMGIPPSGKRAEMRGVNIHTVVDGKITGAESVVDMMTMMQQIGALPG
jgi:steroid delta-isomerase-like uncharacterized protein